MKTKKKISFKEHLGALKEKKDIIDDKQGVIEKQNEVIRTMAETINALKDVNQEHAKTILQQAVTIEICEAQIDAQNIVLANYLGYKNA